MKDFILQIEADNIRWAKMRLNHAVSSMRWLWMQSGLFFVMGLFFVILPLTGGSWFNIATTLIYWTATVFFIWRFMPIHRREARHALRALAEARIRMRKIMEEEY